MIWLVAAYRNKISKESAGKNLAHDANVQHAIRTEVQDIINSFDKQLEARADPWVCGSEFTMADIVWGISLYRLHWLGLAHLWENLPHVLEYADLVYHRPSIWEDVINFPSPMPESPHTANISR